MRKLLYITKLLPFALVPILMCACQAAPDDQAVISKNDGSFEAGIQQTAPSSETGDIMLSRHDSFNSTDGSVEFTWKMDETISAGTMPVVEVVPHSLSGDEVERVAKILLPDAVFYEQEPDSNPKYWKKELQDAINRWSNYANQESYSELVGIEDVDWTDEITALKSRIQSYSQKMETASDENPHDICTWAFKPENFYYSSRPYNNDIIQAVTNINGRDYTINAVKRVKGDYIINGITLSIGTTTLDRQIYRAQMCRTGEPTSENLTAATKVAQEMLDQMNLGEWKAQNAIVEIDYCGDIPEYTIWVDADPVLEGVTALDGQSNPNFFGNDTYSSEYYMSSIFFRFSPTGELMYFGLDSPIETKNVINENVKTLPLDDLLEIAENHLKLSEVYSNYGVPTGSVEDYEEYAGEKIIGKVEITQIRYGLARIKAQNEDENYYYIPAIALYGTVDYYGKDSNTFYMGSGEPYGKRVQALVWVNAVDGTIIEG